MGFRLWVERAGRSLLGPGRVELLERIDRERSISAAARGMKMSYRRAWLLVRGMNEAAGEPRGTDGQGTPSADSATEVPLVAGTPAGIMRRLIVALDTVDLTLARTWADAVGPHAGMVKLGLEFFLAHGRAGYRAFADLPIFLDLKLHDIPNTVARAVAAAAAQVDQPSEARTRYAQQGYRLMTALPSMNPLQPIP